MDAAGWRSLHQLQVLGCDMWARTQPAEPFLENQLGKNQSRNFLDILLPCLISYLVLPTFVLLFSRWRSMHLDFTLHEKRGLWSILKDYCYGGGERRRCRSTFVGNRDDGFAFSWSGYMYMNKEEWVICGNRKAWSWHAGCVEWLISVRWYNRTSRSV